VTEGHTIDDEAAPSGAPGGAPAGGEAAAAGGTDAVGHLRVALVLGRSTEGIARHVLSLVRGLTGRGTRVDVYCPGTTEDTFAFGEAGARVTVIDDIPASPGPRDVGVVSHLRRALRAESVDLIHAHGLRAGFVAAIARPRDTPLVVSWHQTFASHPLARLAHRGMARTVAGTAELSLCASDELVAMATRLGAKDARLCLLPAPVLPAPSRDPAQVRDEFGLAADTPLLLSVGRLHVDARHDVLVSAAARWRLLRPTPNVIIEGTGPAYRDLAAQIITSRAPVILAGHRADLADLLGAADLAVITSDGGSRDGFAQEALASGVALVVADQGGLPETVGDAALLVASGDVDALDTAVRSLLEHSDRRSQLATAGLARAQTWPTESDTLTQVAAAYVEIAGRNDAITATGSPRRDNAPTETAPTEKPPTEKA
jgi:glycosyltransferase involved in cell wall biosynthesis